jgi:hypothetical protein
MRKRIKTIFVWTFFLIGLSLVILILYDKNQDNEEDLHPPSHISSYPTFGYYKYDPKTILTSIDRGDKAIFTQMFENPTDIEEIKGITIRWTQKDFFKIASAFGKYLWNDPMSLNDWKIYLMVLEGSCDKQIGYSDVEITYFKSKNLSYITRKIEIHPYSGYILWGSDSLYNQPILHKWESVDLSGVKISSDDATQIVSTDVSNRFKIINNCGLLLTSPHNNDLHDWYFDVFADNNTISYIVNMETGVYTTK